MGPNPNGLPIVLGHFRRFGYRTAAIGKIHCPEYWIEDDSDFFLEIYEGCSIEPNLESEYTKYLREKGLLELRDDAPASMWFYHRAILLLGMAGIGDHETENEILATIERDVCPQGLIPEQLNRGTGHLGGCSYLTTSRGCMLLYAYHNKR